MKPLNVFFNGTQYPVTRTLCPTWRDVIVRILAMLRSQLNPDDYEIRDEGGTIMVAATATPNESAVSFFVRKKGTIG